MHAAWQPCGKIIASGRLSMLPPPPQPLQDTGGSPSSQSTVCRCRPPTAGATTLLTGDPAGHACCCRPLPMPWVEAPAAGGAFEEWTPSAAVACRVASTMLPVGIMVAMAPPAQAGRAGASLKPEVPAVGSAEVLHGNILHECIIHCVQLAAGQLPPAAWHAGSWLAAELRALLARAWPALVVARVAGTHPPGARQHCPRPRAVCPLLCC